MLVTHEREKLINAILYFAHNTGTWVRSSCSSYYFC